MDEQDDQSPEGREPRLPVGIESWELEELLNLVRGLVAESAHLRRQRDEARLWARRTWLWVVEHEAGADLPFEETAPQWLREGD